MNQNDLPAATQALIADALRLLDSEAMPNLPARLRMALLRSLGPCSTLDSAAWQAQLATQRLPELAFADRVRARIARQAAERVVALWPVALSETQARYGRDEAFEQEERLREHAYWQQRRNRPIEQISVYDVPRLAIPAHIMAMTDWAWRRAIADEARFLAETGEWWQVYPGGEGGAAREIAIKWAAQESLYAITGRIDYHQDPPDSSADLFSAITDGPSGHAALAYADPTLDAAPPVAVDRLRSFWHWWLTQAIPRAWLQERQATQPA
ncbi:MAG: hypothetical protein OHK0022_21070 [Roseiflexaceae bacterium]